MKIGVPVSVRVRFWVFRELNPVSTRTKAPPGHFSKSDFSVTTCPIDLYIIAKRFSCKGESNKTMLFFFFSNMSFIFMRGWCSE